VNLNRRWPFAFILIVLLTSTTAFAQDCPADIILALSRTVGLCLNTERDTACYGSGSIQATLTSTEGNLSFAKPGDKISAEALATLEATPPAADDWNAAMLRIRGNLPVADQRSITLFLFGDVSLQNQVEAVPQINLTARANANLRALPEAEAEIVERVAVNSVLSANGISEDGAWFRVTVPNTDISGWVSTEVVLTNGDANSLHVVNADTPIRSAFDEFLLETGMDDAPCDAAPPSGLLLQTPNREQEVTLKINGAVLRFAGTLFLQAQEQFTVNVLDGFAWVQSNGVERYVPAGARAVISQDAEPQTVEPYAYNDVQALPVMFLESRFAVPQPLTPDDIETLTAQANAPVIEATEEANPAEQCRRRVIWGEYLYDGPGEDYEQLDFLEPRQRVYPIGQTTGEDGEIWWQLRPHGSWVQARGIESEGDCPIVPETDFARAPGSGTNTLQLDTCTTTNGPILSRQHVTITFIPRVWGTFEEAELATYRDRGRITVGNQRLHVAVDGPVRVGEYRYIRAFSATWIARPGTFRVAGRHLAYEIICNINVPVGR
jgi:hypothetical protein